MFRKWDMRNDNLAITSRIVRRFKNQQRHFIHFAELCHLTRLLRKASIGRSNFCLNYVIRGLEATEVNQCLSRNCIDFFLLALNCWKSELCAIRALSMSCWRHSERQMSTGHFVKLATLIMIVLARILCESSQNDSYVTTPKSFSIESTLHDRMSRELNFISGRSVDKPSIGQTPIMNIRRNSQKDRKELPRMDFAPYVSFDELYANFDSFHKIVQTKGLSVRLLGLISAYVAGENIAEILSPRRLDGLPCILVDVSLLPGDFKRSLTVDAGLNRLVQFIGSLSLSSGNKKNWRLQALAHTFMDGVDMRSYGEVVRITRPYAQAINF
ncbi:unnamed protein product [Taenia asiatica]|uniref:DUF4477 domain-containing protein n=1 Tax=Taenia asiatica TaxID=60517 RepID=A0A0R3VX61_TAEAS|nr:unnamed protein product [Taenia asiatica]